MQTLGFKFMWLVIASLLILGTIAACGEDSADTPEPTPTPAPIPAATNAPPPTPTPAPSMPMQDFRIGMETTGSELLSHLSESESTCMSSAMGEANFDLFQQAPFMLAASQEGTYSLLANCLEHDNLIVLGVGLMSVKNNGWEPDSLECVTAVATEHPELVYLALGLEDRIPDLDHLGNQHAILLDFYQCLNTVEQVILNVVMRSQVLVPFTGQDLLNILSDSEVQCIRSALSEAEFSMLEDAPELFTSEDNIGMNPQALACFSEETFGRIPIEISLVSFGARAEASRSCIIEFLSGNQSFVTLLLQAGDTSEALPPEEFAAISNGAFTVFSCLTEEELLFVQQTYLPTLVP